jgi:hypothetical protein
MHAKIGAARVLFAAIEEMIVAASGEDVNIVNCHVQS